MSLSKLIARTGLLISLLSVGPISATIYTHNLNYNNSDHGNSLSGRVSFDDTQIPGSDSWPNVTTFDTNFITDLTFTYTKDGVPSQITYSDFNSSDARMRIEFSGTPDLSVSNLQTQLTDLAFQSDTDAAFGLGTNFLVRYGQNVAGSPADDFTLLSTTYHSPGPLPLFGLITAFSYMKKLKYKYRLRS